MKKSRFTEEQIAFALRQAETGTPVKEVIRKMGIADHLCARSSAVDGRKRIASLYSINSSI